MKIISHPVTIIMLFVSLSIYVASYISLALPSWLYFYINDFLCMPIVLSLCLTIIRFVKKNNAIYVPLSIVLIVTVYYTFHFEWLLPKFKPRYTSDVIDIVLYVIGGLLFYVFQRRLF